MLLACNTYIPMVCTYSFNYSHWQCPRPVSARAQHCCIVISPSVLCNLPYKYIDAVVSNICQITIKTVDHTDISMLHYTTLP